MAMRVLYTVIDGEVMAETRGGVRKFYSPDPQGNTLALYDNTQTKTDTFTYWPYGELKTRTGTTATPFQFVGTWGFYTDSNARTYAWTSVERTDLVRWLTESMTNVSRNAYICAHNNPSSEIDTSGQSPKQKPKTKITPSPTYPSLDQAAIAWCAKFKATPGLPEMCGCLDPVIVGGKPRYRWGPVGTGEGECKLAPGQSCKPGGGFVHIHPVPPNEGKPGEGWDPANYGFSKGDRVWCNSTQRPLYVCTLDGMVRKIKPGPRGNPTMPPDSHHYGEPGEEIGGIIGVRDHI